MFISIDEGWFIDLFREFGRQANFSVPARRALYAHLTALEADTGVEMELDVIAICIEFTEYSPEDLLNDYRHMLPEGTSPEDALDVLVDRLHDETTVLETDAGTYVIQAF